MLIHLLKLLWLRIQYLLHPNAFHRCSVCGQSDRHSDTCLACTCTLCAWRYECPSAWDMYNSDGDCLDLK